MQNTVKIYVDLPEEGSPTMRPTQAEVLGNGLYRLLPASNYDPEDEIWEFPPGSVVKGEKRMNGTKEILFAVAKG